MYELNKQFHSQSYLNYNDLNQLHRIISVFNYIKTLKA